MEPIYFKFTQHPGDMMRGLGSTILPNPTTDFEGLNAFLVNFMTWYQSDDRVAYLNDLYKLVDDDFADREERANYIKRYAIDISTPFHQQNRRN